MRPAVLSRPPVEHRAMSTTEQQRQPSPGRGGFGSPRDRLPAERRRRTMFRAHDRVRPDPRWVLSYTDHLQFLQPRWHSTAPSAVVKLRTAPVEATRPDSGRSGIFPAISRAGLRATIPRRPAKTESLE